MKSCCVLKIIMTTCVIRPRFSTQYQTCKNKNKTTVCKTKTKTKTDFWSQTGLVLRPTVSDHITADGCSLKLPHHGVPALPLPPLFSL